ncbi:18004_t:CDS:1, partial [Dentiscutata erythropus]
GGLDCRCLISHLPTDKYIVRTLTTVATPHRGSPFMDWCRDNIGVGEISQTFEGAAKVVDDALKQMAEKTRDRKNPNDSRSSLSESRSHSQAVNQKDSFPAEYPRDTIVSTKSDKSESSNASNKKSFSIHLPNFNLSLPNINLSKINLPNNNLSNINLSNINLSKINLSNINLSKINLSSLFSIPQATYTILRPVTQSLIHAVDTPAYSNLTTDYCVNYFNRVTPNDPSVEYYSYGASTNVPFWSPLYIPHQIIKDKKVLMMDWLVLDPLNGANILGL